MKSKYEKLDTWLSGKNKPNSNPNKPNLRKARMNVNLYVIEDYRKKDDFLVRINKPNSNPILKEPKMNVNLYVIEDYENKTALRLQKNKANFKRPFFRKDIYWLPEHILSRNSPLVGYSLRSLNREYIASRVL